MYGFIDGEAFFTYFVLYEPYNNLKALPIIRECNVLKKNQEDYEGYVGEIQKTINSLAKNNANHIRSLSENMQ